MSSTDVAIPPAANGGTPPAPARSPPKLFLVVVSVIADFLMTGVTYGYSGIVPVLTLETKAFASYCLPKEALPCDGQIQALTAAFTLSVSTISASGVPIGLLLDAVGPRHTSIIGSLVFALGLVSFTAAPGVSDQLYYWGFFLLSLGGPAVIMATMNFADLFPSVSSAIISAQNGAFDASSAVMFLMGKAVTGLGVSLGMVMLSYVTVPAAFIVIAILFFPDRPFGLEHAEAEAAPGAESSAATSIPVADGPAQTGELWRLYFVKLASMNARPGSTHAETISDLRNESLARSSRSSRALDSSSLKEPLLPASTQPEAQAHVDGTTAPLVPALAAPDSVPLPPDVHNSDIKIQLRSPIFWVLVLVSSYLVTRSNFYIASIYQQLIFAAQVQEGGAPGVGTVEEMASFYVDIFNYIMPIGGALSVLLSAWFMVHLGLTSTFTFIGGLCIVVSTLQLLAPNLPLPVQVAGFVIFAVLRAFIFGAIAAFLGQIFGFRNFGRLFGISRVAGAVVTIIQYPLIHLAESTFDGDYRPVDLGFLIIEIIMTISFPLYLWKRVFYGYFFIPPTVQRVPPSN